MRELPLPRRIVRRAVMALTVVVLLPVGYYGSIMMLGFCYGAGWISQRPMAEGYGAPWNMYWRSGMPGGDVALRGVRWAATLGHDFRKAFDE